METTGIASPIMNGPSNSQTVAETVIGGILAAAPWWIQLVAEVNILIGLVTALCGLFIAAFGVVKIIRRERP